VQRRGPEVLMLGRLVAVALAALQFIACSDTLEVSTTPQALTSANRLGYNRLGYNRLGYNRLGYNKLSATALTASALVAGDWDEVLADEDARILFRYIYECAAEPGQSLELPIAGAVHAFTGVIGLAPEWTTGACGVECEQWISACVIARINGLGVSVPLSLRGDHPALVTTESERAEFRFEELAAFGNIFEYDPETGYPRVLGVCKLPGISDQLAYYGVEPSHWLERRICGEPGQCGPLQVYGECKNPMTYAATQGMPQEIACEYKQDRIVDHCHPQIATVPGQASLGNGGLDGYFTTPSYRAINVVLQDRVCGDTWCDLRESFCEDRRAPACASDCPGACDAFAYCGDGVCDAAMTRKRYDISAYVLAQLSREEIERYYVVHEPYEETAQTCPQDCRL
jgi:hypothetical protein